MAGKYTEFEKHANGVRIILLPEAREDAQAIAAADLDADSKLSEMIEWQLGNGWSWVRPEDIGALTDAPILSDDIEYDDHGNVVSVGAVYWYPHYDIADPSVQLLTDGYIDFVRVE